MRENKFKAWDKKNKIILEVTGLHFSNITNNADLCTCVDNELNPITLKDGEFELVEFTSWKDKNGREIYEKMECKGRLGNGCWYYYGIVVFDKGAFSMKITKRDGTLKDYDIGSTPELNNFDELEIIQEFTSTPTKGEKHD